MFRDHAGRLQEEMGERGVKVGLEKQLANAPDIDRVALTILLKANLRITAVLH